MNCVDIVGGDFNVAAFREPRKLGRTEDPCGLVFAHAPRRSPDVEDRWRTLPIATGSSERQKTRGTWKTNQHGSIQAAHLLVYTH